MLPMLLALLVLPALPQAEAPKSPDASIDAIKLRESLDALFLKRPAIKDEEILAGKGEKYEAYREWLHSIEEAVRAFADKHRPSVGGKQLDLSVGAGPPTDKSSPHFLHIVVMPTATQGNAKDLEFSPKRAKYEIAVAGNGADGKASDGGAGGAVFLKAAAGKDQTVILVGGSGGKGADGDKTNPGKTGGHGGGIWFSGLSRKNVIFFPGNGGKGGTGNPGGTGGNGGPYGEKPPR